jgi:hypothetical protein
MIMKSSRASSNISHLTRPFTQSGWRDLNSRPLDPQIGPLRSLSVNDLSVISVVERGHALSVVGLVRNWSVLRLLTRAAVPT